MKFLFAFKLLLFTFSGLMIDIVVFSIQQCEEESFMRSLNNMLFGINQSVVFEEILVLE